ncbi:methyl-accepting chemotaxis protein [Geovibrio thiophilus]|uniref:Methyl-accepting chemotaxis protein n=1 Tax=Geovibrio thiophilus TaxID=139438 RepID=A0A410K0C1_9BACT|nr:methyl-accepting chemotaxis protein [Geovibrio thiophilus]QAR33860.1 methyl-accepting chemotaxis protein [Geovibrio thiophilus]
MFNFTSGLHDRLLKPLERMASGRWDLNGRFESLRGGLAEKAGNVLNKVFESLRKTIESISKSSVTLSQIAPELDQAAKSLEEQSKIQAEKVVQIAAAGKQMAVSVEHVTDSTLEATQFSSQITKSAGIAMEKSRLSEKSMLEVKEMVTGLKNQMEALSEQSGKIGSIMEMIKKIADQTNLLSLNASIEAARAGEAGRGFAVVATEVRKLAEQSMEATNGVEGILYSIKSSIETSMGSVGKVLSSVEKSAGISEEAVELLSDVAAHMDELDRHLNTIAAAGQEQDVTVKSVVSEIDGIAAAAEEQSALATQLGGIVDKINGGCDDLLVSVGVFRTGSHERAEKATLEAAKSREITSMNASSIESYMNQFIKHHSYIELAYITDARGRQISPNIWNKKVRESNDSRSVGSDWATRDWFRKPKETGDVYVTDIYRSVATDNFCFTVAVPVKDSKESFAGVLAVDISFADMM